MVLALGALLLVAGGHLSLVPSVSADFGGPDGYGYTWTDSRQPNPGVTFNWVPEGVTQGTELALPDDGCTNNRVTIGFNFGFYGTTYANVYVCANGFLAFGAPGSLVEYMENYVAALGMDLNPTASGSGKVYAWADGASTPKRFIVTWNGVYTFGTTQAQTFQIVLTDNPSGDGTILLQYRTLNSVGYHVTGIENRTGAPSLMYEAPLNNTLAVLFVPPEGPRPPDVLSVTAQSLAPAAVEIGQADVPMIALNLTTGGLVEVTSVRVDLTGVFPFPTDVSVAELWLDADGDKAFDASRDSRIAASGFAGNPPQALLIPSPPLAVTAALPRWGFVVYDIADNARAGDWIGAAVRDASYLQVASPDTVVGANLPLDTYVNTVRTQVLAGVDTLTMRWSALSPPEVPRWRSDVPFLALDLNVSTFSTTVEAITVRLTGVPPWPGDVRMLKALLDANGDRQVVGDRLLAVGTFQADNNATLPVNLTVPVSSPRSILLVLDIAGNAVLGDTVGLEVAGPSSIQIPATSGDQVSPSNFPAATAPSAIIDGARPTLVSQWPETAPVPDGAWSPEEYFASGQNSASFGDIGGNEVGGYVVVANDDRFLYVVLDASGDVLASAADGASIAFDEDFDGLPTNGSDSQFTVGGPSGLPAHHLYNETGGTWVEEDPCDPLFDARHDQLACRAGFSLSDLDPTPHRVYEFRIPLALLNVTSPIPPNTTVGFAMASARMAGVIDAPPTPGTATWPFLFPAAPALSEFASLALAVAPPPNALPELNWTGEPGFVGDGVDPDAGTEVDLYTFRVNYSDRDGDLPALGHPKLSVRYGAAEIAGSPFAMTEAAPEDVNVSDGKVYTLSLTLACPRAYRYVISAGDARGAVNRTAEMPGPTVSCAPRPPVLTLGSVTPSAGEVNTTVFTYNVTYADPEGAPPAWIFADIQKAGVPYASLPMALFGWAGEIGNYSQGAWYHASTNFTVKGDDYTYAFSASDGSLSVSTTSRSGPAVLAEPGGLLTITLFDEAPFFANQGATNVRMWSAVLTATGRPVVVTDVRMDRTGEPVDADVAQAKLFHDRDGTRSVSPGDLLLGSATFSNSRAAITGFRLTVDPTSSVSLLAVVDVGGSAIPDNRIGLRVVDRSYVTVESPSLVEPFPAFQTTQAVVNGPPDAANVLIDGFPPGSPGITHLSPAVAPMFSWTFADPNAGDLVQRGYNVSVFSEATGTLVWYRNESVADNSVPYGGPALVRGRPYALVVRLSDGRTWGVGTQVSFRVNSVPPGPAPTSPIGAGIAPGPLRLQWSASTDPDGDPVDYRWFLTTSSDFTADVVQGNTSATEASVSVLPRTTYYWRARAGDGYELGPFGPVATFTTVATHGSVRGRIVSSAVPVAGATLALYDDTGGLRSQTTTGGLGAFLFEDVPVGTYSLQIAASGYRPRTLETIIVAPNDPDVDLGDVPLEALPSPPTLLDQILAYLPYAAAVAAIVAIAVILGSRLRRRPEREEPLLPEDWLEEPKPREPEAKAEPSPKEEAAATEPEARAVLEFECPNCETRVAADAKTCFVCGVEFADP